MIKETCILCGRKTKRFRYAYRKLRDLSVDPTMGFAPRIKTFSYEEIKLMEAGGYNEVCEDRDACSRQQRKNLQATEAN